MSSLMCAPGSAAYSASKAGLNALSLATANETSGHNILVNAMSPGFIKTDMNPVGSQPPSAAVPTAIDLACLPDDGPSGRFFRFQEEVIVIPESSDAWKK
jgi:NAD(P)-dependent dehydrogenase (short-subunit alcohol dehydrogenase family)